MNAGTGREQLDNIDTRLIGTAGNTFGRRDTSLTLSQMLFDGFAVRSEVARQTARVDSSAYGAKKRKLVQIVMFGQPELDRKLQAAAIRQLNQRITFHYQLRPLNQDDMAFYLSHRLAVAGFTGGRLFKPGALKTLHRASGGFPA